MITRAMKTLGVVIIAAWMCVTDGVQAGSLDSPSPPTNPSSAMYTLSDIYTKLDTGAPGSKRSGGFVGPTNAPGSTGHTLDELMDKTPSTNADAAGGEDVLNGKIYWGLKSGEWGTRTGAMATCVLSATTTVVAAGYYGSTNLSQVDPKLAAENIVADVTIFGVEGGLIINTNQALVAKTGQTNSYAPGDDGYYQKGLAWPSPRFMVGTDAESNCVTDNLTGLMWLRNLDATKRSWTNSLSYCEALNGLDGRGNFTDWRMPNVLELQSLIAFQYYNPALPNTEGTGQWTPGAPFVGVLSDTYWSSTYDADSYLATFEWVVNVGDGRVLMLGTTVGTAYVWPVRGGQ